MEPVLIYTDSNLEDAGAIETFTLDLAFGSDEQNFEASFAEPVLTGGELLYIDGTEYGGIVDEIVRSTETQQAIYRGRTWHGMLAGKILKPASGQAYYTLSGDANACIRSIIAKTGLGSVLTGRSASSGINIPTYQFQRFTNAYNGLIGMLGSVNAILRIERHDGITELWAEPRQTIADEADSDLLDFTVTETPWTVNHLICAGEGELQDRVIVDLYADAAGNISQTQTFSGVNEIAKLYDFNSATRDELIANGTKELKKYQGGGAEIDAPNHGDWHVGDLLQVRDNNSGTAITSTIAKKIVKVNNGVLSVEYDVGDTVKAAGFDGAAVEVGTLVNMQPTGTPSSSTYLRGDATWASLNTWTAVSASDYITLASGWQADNIQVRYNAALGVVRVYLYITTTSAQAAGNKTLGTVAAAYRPKNFPAAIPSITEYAAAGYIQASDGALRVNIKARSAGQGVYLVGEYHITN